MLLKEKIYRHFVEALNGKIDMLQQVLADLKESGSNETKSTAGDKHETALAMLQIEQENNRARLKELLEQKASLEKIDPLKTASMVAYGSLVRTNRGYLFISTALGRATVENITVIALSPNSPLGEKLMGLKVNDTVLMNNVEYRVEEIG
ncbi:MAG TPA: hypothetical protein VHL77_06585 [Ferruginibacter sp.]|jgi:transcription elongation GreA/GreB family factor|nr:hypothetical protein [Ferruginibacter sp.]